MIALAFIAVALLAATGYVVYRVSGRFWQAAVVLIAAFFLYAPCADHLTGDVSRFLPSSFFAEGLDGKDQIVLASAVATLVVALILATAVWCTAFLVWRHVCGINRAPH